MQDDFQEFAAPSTDPRVYVAAVWKHAWLLILVWIGVTAGGVYYASIQPSVYESAARIVIESANEQILEDVAPVVNSGGQNMWAMREFLETQYRIMGSMSVANEVATRLNLADDLGFLGLTEIEDPEVLAAAREAANPGRRVQAAVSIEPVEATRVVVIRARAGDPRIAAGLANTTAEVYIDRNLSRQLESTDNAAEWLDQQYDDLGSALRDSESALVEFRQANDLIAVELDEHVSLLSRMEATSTQLEDARLEADRANALLRQVSRAMDSGDVLESDIPLVVENPLIQSLKSELYIIESERIELSGRYLEEHPLMVAVMEREELARERLEREVSNLLAATRQRAERADRLVSTLASRLSRVESDVQRLGTHQVEYGGLLREAELNRELFEMIERRRKEVELSRNSLQNNVEILEVASVPGGPVSPNKPLLAAVACMFGLFLGILAALGLEGLDSTVKSQEAVERKFGLTFLGVIPKIDPTPSAKHTLRGPRRGESWSPERFVHQFPRSPVAESCRAIRTNLSFLGSEEPLDTLLVTSAGPREGKTTTSMNMATVMAQSGSRVLLVDADLRRPRVHTACDLENISGLSDILVDGARVEDVVQESGIPGLEIMTSGPVPPNPAELLESEPFRRLTEELKSRYDRVIFDSPPIAPVTDAAVLSATVDGVVLVVRSNVTRTEVLGRSVEMLTAVNANIIGAVFNDVDLNSRRAGNSYYYYYQQYASYYGEDESETDAA